MPNILGWIFILFICFAAICIFLALNSGIERQSFHKKHPYIFGVFVSGIIGSIIVAILISNAHSLETYIGACVFSLGVMTISVIVGVLIGKQITMKAQQKE